MNEENNTKQETENTNEFVQTHKDARAEISKRRSGRSMSSRKPLKGRGRRDAGKERKSPEFEQRILNIRRVTRVVAGGRRFSFSVAMLLGDKKGSIGVGMGKATDTSLAISKAMSDAKKSMITIKTTKNGSIPHLLDAKYASARVMLMPNRSKGLVAGSSVRDILLLSGVKDVTSKIHSRSKNKVNIARATIKALSAVSTPYKRKAPADKLAKDNDATGTEETKIEE